MTSWEVEAQVFPEFRRRVTQKWLRRVAGFALDGESQEPQGIVTVVIADDSTLQRLNREYAGIDEVTDVLSFTSEPLENDAGTGELSMMPGGFITPTWEPPLIGDVIVSYPQAARQARSVRHTVRLEVATLVTHGVLHLLGYDHATKKQAHAMAIRQAQAMGQVL